jgi:predicted transcriptional regulator
VVIKAKDIMYKPVEGEYVEADATLDEAIHQLVMGRHQSLLVTEKGRIVGILRLTDVFDQICEVMKTCAI